MIAEYNEKSLAIGLPGLFFQVAGALARMYFLHKHGGELNAQLNWTTLLVQIVATIVLMVGLGSTPKRKATTRPSACSACSRASA